MSKYIFALLVFISPAHAEDWSRDDTYREAVYLSLHTVDWLQTRNIAREPTRYYEYNKVIGAHPTVGWVNNYFSISAITHIGITYLLPEEYRDNFQYVTIGFKSGLVYHNFKVGISVKF